MTRIHTKEGGVDFIPSYCFLLANGIKCIEILEEIEFLIFAKKSLKPTHSQAQLF